jgi:hypothetical protein
VTDGRREERITDKKKETCNEGKKGVVITSSSPALFLFYAS